MSSSTNSNRPTPMPRGFDVYAVACCHLFRQERSVRYVVHGPDGWSFSCGGVDHDPECWGTTHTHHLLDIDASLAEIAMLPVGAETMRFTAPSPWLRLPDLA